MEKTHTPGPWAVAQSSNPKNGTAWRDIVSHGTTFAPSYVGEAMECDAYLIAAAPDLLMACTHALAVCEAEAELRGDNDTDEYAGGAAGPVADMLRAAIAKAKVVSA